MKNLEILSKNPYEREKEDLEKYERNSREFYRIFKGDIGLQDNFTEIQLEIIFELINIFQSQIKYLENEIKKHPRSRKRFEVLFLTKEKYYERILNRFSKYISLLCYGDFKNLEGINLKNLQNCFKKGINEVIEVIENDVTKYDLLFSELDDYQNDSKKIEIYLGRDGIYAYEARRALDIARRKKLIGERVKRRKIVEIHPKYINYNTFIKDSYSEEDRKKYLESNGILSEQDMIIFDTGFTGSIPEQILKTLGFKNPDLEHRIKILGTYYTNKQNENESPEKIERIQKRLVKGILANEESYRHVDIIEERPKNVMTANGIFEDQNGKLKPIENPYFNEFYFQYGLIELTLRQYYFNREYFKN